MSTFVLFFGGWRATPADMQAWQGSAKAQRSNVDFDAIPWPSGAASDASSAISVFTKRGGYKSAIAALQSSKADKIYIVGHSSGCAIANAVDAGLTDHSNIVLVALDGFVPNRKQLARQSTQVWAARTLKLPFLTLSANCVPKKGEQADDKCISRNYRGLKNAVGSRLQVYFAAPDCTTKWALHFSLVNSAANDKLVTGKTSVDIVAKGYSQCIANLVWL
ncbi:MAG: hypothetical protein H6972_08620 [Gammaproteobacteria bacterium]|nr:hypothetical protein [Gammaproteobacteria bacterium]